MSISSLIVSSTVTQRAVRFGFTGILNTVVHIAIASSLIEMLKFDPSLANGIAFVFATLLSYFINTYWSFSSKPHGRTLYRFVIVSILGLLLAMGLSALVNHFNLSYWYGILAVICVMPPTNFLFHHFWTYK